MASESFNKQFKITKEILEKASKNPKTLYKTNRDLAREEREAIKLLSKEKRVKNGL